MRGFISLASHLGLLVLALAAMPLAAHSEAFSEVRLAPGDKTIHAEVVIPAGEYALGTGYPINNGDPSLDRAKSTLEERVSVRSHDDPAWMVKVSDVEFTATNGPKELRATLELMPSQDRVPTEFTIDWKVLAQTAPNHVTYFILEDPASTQRGAVVGAINGEAPQIDVSTQSTGKFDALSGAIKVGAAHILEGYDHLLFLVMLLLPAPFIAVSGRWSERRSTRAALVKLAQIVTAFTIGHSLTLILSATWNISLPSAPVEVAIAVSVLLSAIHAVRPIFARYEALVAAAFGLVHGLAFATLVREVDAGMESSLLTLAGFNLGIEIVQIAIVAVLLPALLVLAANARYYATVCRAVALFAATISFLWIVNRTSGLASQSMLLLEGAMLPLSGAMLIVIVLGAVSPTRTRL